MKKIFFLMVVLSVSSVAAHTGDNHTAEQLETDAHRSGDDFQFVRGDYPMETKYIVIAEIVLVGLLFAASVHHYRKKSRED